MMRSRRRHSLSILSLLISLFFLSGLGDLSAQPPDFSNLVFLGDSLTAGWRNGTLTTDTQLTGYATLLARQLNAPLFQPLADPRFIRELEIVERGFPFTVRRPPGDFTRCQPILLGCPSDPANPCSFCPRLYPFVFATNLAVPGHNLNDLLTRKPSLSLLNAYTLIVLGIPAIQTPFGARTQLEMASIYRPSFAVVWIGNNDALGAALSADPSQLTPPDVFRRQYTELINSLRALGTKIVVANIPDVTAVAALTSREKLARYLRRDVNEISALLGLKPGDFVTSEALEVVADILAGRRRGPLPDRYVLTAAKVATVRAAVTQFNTTLRDLSEAYPDFRFPIVDVYSIFNDLVANGYPIGNYRLTTDFLGGIFSLDGVHPSVSGYALITNYFVDAINNFYGTQVPRVSEAELLSIIAKDPLVPTQANRVEEAAPVLSMSAEDYKALCNMMVNGALPEMP